MEPMTLAFFSRYDLGDPQQMQFVSGLFPMHVHRPVLDRVSDKQIHALMNEYLCGLVGRNSPHGVAQHNTLMVLLDYGTDAMIDAYQSVLLQDYVKTAVGRWVYVGVPEKAVAVRLAKTLQRLMRLNDDIITGIAFYTIPSVRNQTLKNMLLRVVSARQE